MDAEPGMDNWLIGNLREHSRRTQPEAWLAERLLADCDEESSAARLERLEAAINDVCLRLTSTEGELRKLARAGASAAEVGGHTLFVPTAAGYVILEHDGPPPAPGERLVIDEQAYRVEGRRRSPFLSDARPCLVLAAQ